MSDEPFRPISVKGGAELLVERRLARAREALGAVRAKAAENRRDAAVLMDRAEQLGDRIGDLEAILDAIREDDAAEDGA